VRAGRGRRRPTAPDRVEPTEHATTMPSPMSGAMEWSQSARGARGLDDGELRGADEFGVRTHDAAQPPSRDSDVIRPCGRRPSVPDAHGRPATATPQRDRRRVRHPVTLAIVLAHPHASSPFSIRAISRPRTLAVSTPCSHTGLARPLRSRRRTRSSPARARAP